MEVPAVYTFAPSSRVQTKFIPCYRTYTYTRTSLILGLKNPGRLWLSNFSILPQVYHERCLLNTSPTALSSWTRSEGDVTTNYLCFQVAASKWLLPSGYHSHNFAQWHAISNNRLKVRGGVVLNLRCTMGAKWLVSEFSNFLISVRLPTPGAPGN